MAGRQRAGAESLGDRDHRSDPDLPVATDARVRRHPRPVSLQERLDDPGAERVAEIDGQVGDPLRVGDRARHPDRIGRAAAPLAVVGRIRPELQRHGQDVRPALPLAQRRHGAVDPAAHRHQDPLGPILGGVEERAARARDGHAQRPMQRLRGEVGRMRSHRAQAAELRRDRGGIDQRRLPQAGAVGELRDRGRCRPRRRAAAAGLADVRHPPRPQPQRDPDQVAAGSAAGATAGGSRQGLAEPRVVIQIELQGR